MVVNLGIDGKDDLAVGANDWLSTSCRIYNGQTLVANYALVIHNDSVPVRPTMAQPEQMFENCTINLHSVVVQFGKVQSALPHFLLIAFVS